jgi:hypothetical protein
MAKRPRHKLISAEDTWQVNLLIAKLRFSDSHPIPTFLFEVTLLMTKIQVRHASQTVLKLNYLFEALGELHYVLLRWLG